jgi:hypothetical protein
MFTLTLEKITSIMNVTKQNESYIEEERKWLIRLNLFVVKKISKL